MQTLQILRKFREHLGLTQSEMGAKLGVDGMTISRWERGETLPQRRFWPGIERLTKTRVVEMLAGHAEPPGREEGSHRPGARLASKTMYRGTT